jgi:hypothetical protein
MSNIEHWAEWLAARISAVEARRSDELPDVCRWHRDLAAEIVKHIDHQHQGAVKDLRWVADGLADLNQGRRRNLGITRNCEVRLREVIARLEGGQ